MSFEVLEDLNWLAVIVAALAYFLLGAVWYAPPVFGRAWMRASGIEVREGEGPGPAFYALPLVADIVAAVALGMLARATGSDSVGEGIVLGLVVGVGFVATVIATTGLFDTKKPIPGLWALITGAYNVVGLLIAAVIVSVWD